MTLTIGDVVVLVGGGPNLTVICVDETDHVLVGWFCKKDRYRKRELPREALVRANVVSP